MTSGEVVQIGIAPKGAAPLRSVRSVRAFAGRGLEGDRYFEGTGTFIKPGHVPASQQASLIEIEAIEALEREYSIQLPPIDSRRNIITRGVPLNHLVGVEFAVGKVRMKGIKLCEPCGHLAKLTQETVRKGLVHRGGLRAQILTDGKIRVGDRITVHRLESIPACA